MALLTCLLFLWIGGFAGPTQAGVLSAPGTESCDFRFSGKFERGDAAQFRAVMTPFDTRVGWRPTVWLCLDSRGGSLAEALEIGRIIRAAAVATRLTRDAECLSACAVLFMLGSEYLSPAAHERDVLRHPDDRYPTRMMHVTARLGFHRPSLTLDATRSYSGAQVDASFNIATDAALEMVRLVARGILDPGLVDRMLSHRGEDFFEINTVGKALRWKITLDDVEPAKRIDSLAALEICKNLRFAGETFAEGADVTPYRAQPVEVMFGPADGEEGFLFEVTASEHPNVPHFCRVFVGALEDDPISVCGYFDVSLNALGGYACWGLGGGEASDMARDRNLLSDRLLYGGDVSALAALPWATPLGEINAQSREVERRAALELTDERTFARDAFRRRCRGRARVEATIVAGRSVPMRNAPHRGAAVVGTLSRQVWLSPHPRRWGVEIGEEEKAGDCARLCRTALDLSEASAEWQALESCFERDVFWYPFQHPENAGETVYVNGKYLRY